MRKIVVLFLLSTLFLFCLSLSTVAQGDIKVAVDGEELSFDVPPANIDNRTLVPLRAIFEALGSEMDWNSVTQTVQAIKGDLKITLTVGKNYALRNDIPIEMDVPAKIIAGRILVPVRFIAESLGAAVEWNDAIKTVTILSKGEQPPAKAPTPSTPSSPGPIKPESYNKEITLGNKKVRLNIIEIPPQSKLQPMIGIGQNNIGKTEEMASIAQRFGAVAAINGGYFQAYDFDIPMDPYGTLINKGKVIHRGDTGSTIGFTEDGQIKLDTLRMKIEGSTNNSYSWPNNWYSYGINHTPTPNSSSIFIYTPERGERIGFDYGTNVIVEKGRVVNILQNTDAHIPTNGFVINFLGSETYLLDRFKLGVEVDFRIAYTNMHGQKLDWSNVVTAVGAGPLLIKNGLIIADPEAEGFFEDKVLTASFNRSAIGVKPDDTLFLVTTSSVTIKELASAMSFLGATNAMCLDSGGSSGLYFNNKYLWQPGRDLSNILMFVQ